MPVIDSELTDSSRMGFRDAFMVADFWVDGWLVQPRFNVVIGKDRTILLRPITMTTIGYLAKRTRQVVPASEILQAVWNNPTIPRETLACILSEIQEAFRDDTAEHAVFRLMPDLSCRLDADVKWHLPPAPTESDPVCVSGAHPPSVPNRGQDQPEQPDSTGR